MWQERIDLRTEKNKPPSGRFAKGDSELLEAKKLEVNSLIL
jgi:hypothetical protein